MFFLCHTHGVRVALGNIEASRLRVHFDALEGGNASSRAKLTAVAISENVKTLSLSPVPPANVDGSKVKAVLT